MSVITIGDTNNNGYGSYPASWTTLTTVNPANFTGIITEITVYISSATNNVKIGTFYLSGGKYTCRDYRTFSFLDVGKNTLTGLNIAVVTGDLIGVGGGSSGYGWMNSTVSGSRLYYLGDAFSGSFSFSSAAGQSIAASGIGTTDLGKKINGVTNTKWNGIAITKFNGI